MKKIEKDHLETVRSLLRTLGSFEPDPKRRSGGYGGIKVRRTIEIECPNYACDCSMTIELPPENLQFSHSYSNFELEKVMYELKEGNEDPDDNAE